MNLQKLLAIAVRTVDENVLTAKNHPEALFKQAHKSVIVFRMVSREITAKLNAAENDFNYLTHMKRVALHGLNAQKLTFPLLDMNLDLCNRDINRHRVALVATAQLLSGSLDLWQTYGADLRDLSKLCNLRYKQLLGKIDREHRNDNFSNLIFIYALDYTHKGDNVSIGKDAPLTHAMNALWVDKMVNSTSGKMAATSAFNKFFKEENFNGKF